MQIRITLLIVSFIYTMLTSIVYFSKNRINNSENAVYEKLLSITPIGLLLEMGCNVTAIYKMNDLVSSIISRLYLIFILVWLTTFTLYILTITKYKGDKLIEYKNSKIRKSIIIGSISSILLLIFLPIDFVLEKNSAYLGGIGIVFLLAITFILIVLDFILFIKYFKNMTFREKVPMLLLLLLIGGLLLVNNIAPEIQIISSSFALITVIMYFTIENPDVKMIEEYHKAKEISDNANEEKTMFLYNMTNEIRNITKDIDYSADDILDETSNKKVDVEVINDAAREIKGSTAKFTTMTNEILDINSIDSASIKVYDDKYNIKLLLKKIVTLYSDECSKKGLTFRSDIASDLPEYLYGDNLGLKNVLTSILDNSIKYTKEGYIELNVNTIIKNNIARLIITIEDSGVGISPDEMDSIFYKRKEEIDGSNMKSNLFTARKLITLMGGTIIPSSIYGTGTTMKIVLDQKVAKEADEKLDKYEEVYDKKKILLVDDNISTEKIVSKLLKDTNIELDYVSLGKEALDKIRGKEKYDLILLDEVMDPLDGVTVMKKFKDIRNFKTNVILLTRNNEYEYNEEYLKYGFSGYLLKPISKDKLFEIIDKYLK